MNLNKSRMYEMGNVANMDRLVECLGYVVGSLPTTYLGLPLGASYKNPFVWDHVVSRIHKRLLDRKGVSYLRVVKWCLSSRCWLASQPIFSLLMILAFVEKKIKQCQRDFLWGRGN